MLKIRQRGGFKPYGAAVSIIEHAQWDIAGKAAGAPVYKLLGGKVRDQVRTYNDSPRAPMDGTTPEHYAAGCKRMMALPEGFDIFKQGIAFHSPMRREFDGFYYATPNPVSPFHGAMDSSPIAERGIAHMIDCVAAMKEVLGDKVALALDCGPGRGRRHRRAQVDRRICSSARYPDGAAWHWQRPPGPCGIGPGLCHASGEFHCFRISQRC